MPQRTEKGITFTHGELEAVLEKAAQEGARRALYAVGLHDENAGADIQDLRALIRSYRAVKSTVWKKLIDRLITLIIGALLMWIAAKCGINIGEAMK